MQGAELLKSLNELGIDADHGVIPLIGEVNEEMYTNLVTALNILSNAGLKYNELTILLSTYGGEVYYAFAIYDLLRSQPINVRIICNGPVMSAGTIILMAGDVRLMTPLSFLMVHYGTDFQASDSDHKHNVRVKNVMKGLYRRNSNADTKTVNKWFTTDTYFSAKDAKGLGLVDGIIEYGKKIKRKKKSAARPRK